MKYNLLLILLCLTVIPVFSITIDTTLLSNIAIDMSSPGCTGPIALGTNNEHIVVSDNLNNRAVYFNTEGSFVKWDSLCYSRYADRIILQENGEYFIYYRGKAFAVDNKEGNKKLYVNFEKSSYNIEDNRSIFYDGERVVAILKSGELISIPNPGNDNQENLSKVEEHEATIDYLLDNPNGFSVEYGEDEEIFLLKNGQLLTFNYEKFVRYYEITSESTDLDTNVSIDFDFASKSKWYFKFLGQDQTGNWYWQYDKGEILVFSDQGVLFDLISTEGISYKVTPAIHPDGSVYFLDYDKDGVRMYCVRK